MKTFYVEVDKPVKNNEIISAGKKYYEVTNIIDSKTFIVEELATGEKIRCIIC